MNFLTEAEIKAAKLLIVDDEPIYLMTISEQLAADGYSNITQQSDPYEAVAAYQSTDFDLVLLDISMLGLDGFGVMEKFSEVKKSLEPPVLVLTASMDRETRHRALKGGARDFLVKPFDGEELLYRVCNLLEMHLSQKIIEDYNQNLESLVERRTRDFMDAQLEIVQRLGYAAEYRDTNTAAHTVRVGEYARILGEELGLKGETLRNLHYTAPMHDIGKVGIADAILLKPGKYTPEETQEMKKHTLIGAKILQGESSNLLKAARIIAQTHHERWDGKGYPAGLAGEEIPIYGRIVMVADVFDALTMARPYKKTWPVDEAVSFIEEHTGTMFDPKVVMAFKARLLEILTIQQVIDTE